MSVHHHCSPLERDWSKQTEIKAAWFQINTFDIDQITWERNRKSRNSLSVLKKAATKSSFLSVFCPQSDVYSFFDATSAFRSCDCMKYALRNKSYADVFPWSEASAHTESNLMTYRNANRYEKQTRRRAAINPPQHQTGNEFQSKICSLKSVKTFKNMFRICHNPSNNDLTGATCENFG